VQSIKHQRATGTVLASYDFVWDAGNRLSSVTSSADGLTTYSYTPTNQLSAIDYANAPDQSFTYDLNGNRTGSGNVTGADNRLTSNATWDFLYDANGNMTRRTLKSDNSYIEYTYDHRDRLTDVRYRTSAGTLTKRVHFGYDALNRRYLQTVENGSGTILSTVYYVNQGFRKDHGDAGDEIALRLDGTGSVISRYLHGSLVDEVLAEENIGSGGVRDVLWAMTDHQGSVRDLARVTSGTASVVNHIVYDAFGKTVSETDAAIAHLYGYTGRELDKETGLQYNRARYLDLVLARWISQDPIGFAAGDTNLYRYVGNHPSYATDPSGLAEGHHWIPLSVARYFYENNLISLEDYHYFGGRTSGPLVGGHFGDKDHLAYNAHVTKQLQKWIDHNITDNSKKIAIEKFVDNIRDGKTFDGKPSSNSYNARLVNPNMSTDRSVIDAFDGGTRQDIEARGVRSIDNRNKSRMRRLVESSFNTKHITSKGAMRILVIVGTTMGVVSNAGNAKAASDVLTDSKAIRKAREWAEKGSIDRVQRWLVGEAEGHNAEPSVYEELRTINPLLAIAFRAAVIASIEAYNRGENDAFEDNPFGF
jgi:RHS repeat-associated protein